MTYNSAMFVHCRTFRSLTVAALMVSLAGMSPVFTVAAARTAAAVDDVCPQTRGRCCCGTSSGKCCGMGCCRGNAPKQQRTPSPHQDRGDSCGTVVLACFASGAAVSASELTGWRIGDGIASPAGFSRRTLQALHVLLKT